MDREGARRTYRAAAVADLAVTAVFSAVILVTSVPGFLLHEVAGLVLFLVTMIPVVLAATHRAGLPGFLLRALLALGLLVGMGLAGASLGTGLIPPSLNALPLAVLVLLMASEAEMIRISRPIAAHAGGVPLDPTPIR